MAIREHVIESISELVAQVISIATSLPENQSLWFRGVRCSSYSLVPKLLREGRPADEAIRREGRLLTRFRQRSLAYWPDGYPQSDWEHLFAMQHYGLPTRLLDWSENLFVSTYFALEGNPTHNTEHEGNCEPIIWCMDPVAWNRAMPSLVGYGNSIHVCTTNDDELESYGTNSTRRRCKDPIAIFGTHNSNRIVTQRGNFVIWGNDSISMENIATNSPALLHKIRIKGDASSHLQSLRLLGFSETMIFPEMSELAKELSRTEGW